MKKFIILILLLIFVVAITACQYIGVGQLLSSNYEKYDLTVLEDGEFEVEIDGKIYRSIYVPWRPLNEKEEIIGIADYNGTTTIFKTSSPLCYKLENTTFNPSDMEVRAPNCLIYDISMNYDLKYVGIKSYHYIEEDNESKNMFSDNQEDIQDLININGDLPADAIPIDESELYVFDYIGKYNFYPQDERFDGTVYQGGLSVYKKFDEPDKYYTLFKNGNKHFYKEITKQIKKQINNMAKGK